MPYISQMCPETHVARVSRHERRVTALLSSALEKRYYKCFFEPYIPTPIGLLKPDVISCREGLTVVIDMQIISNLTLMDERYDHKIQKYDVSAVREHMIRVTSATEVKFRALILD